MAARKATKTGTKKKATKKKAKRRGRPPGRKKAKRRGRPPGRKKAGGDFIRLPGETANELAFWSQMVVFLNKNKGKTFVVQMDGTNYSLVAS